MAEPSPRYSLVPLHETFLSPSPPETTEVLLVRHGQQEVIADPTKTREERTNPPLSAVGRRQAKVVAAALAEEDIAAVYTSTLSRARDTGAAIAAHHDLEIQQVPGIEEIGLFQNLTDSNAPLGADPRLWAGAAALFSRNRSWDAYPMGETSLEFRRRVVTGIESVVAQHTGEIVVIACHGGVINTYLAWTLGLPQDMWFLPAHASISRFRALGALRSLISVNERTHLSATDPELVSY